uniref:Uncharacterized protein n=1 Tax=Candidatus Kentrum sp. LFY TaxID=2126342 RepID=A0A450UZT2_9GAMM|nr:MAG: hypothetical protein BECKLFY1418A_GA0070994_10785 [Candidatus Kentron sp. LFY]
MKKLGVKKIFIAILICMGSINASAGAYTDTECKVHLNRIWAGDRGYIWLHYDEGGSAVVSPHNPDQKNILALSLTAIASGRPIVVRFHEVNLHNCETSGARTDIRGIYLLNQ